jgi:hypothetical protein
MRKLLEVCIRFHRYLCKHNPYNKAKEVGKYQYFRSNCSSYILCWLREFKCEGCGLIDVTRSLHFHHIDSNKKRHSIIGNNVGLVTGILESMKCKYVCEPCHYKEHLNLGDYFGYFANIDRLGCAYIQDLLGVSN